MRDNNFEIAKSNNDTMQKIVPSLWFDNQAEEAVNLYIKIFNNSKILNISYYGEAGAEVSGMSKGQVLTIEFQLNGQIFTALNGGPIFNFTPAISFLVNCKSQEELDMIWDKLSEGGEEQPCGWLKDKYGVSWQIVPSVLGEMMGSGDAQKTEKVMEALLKMKKINIKKLQEAFQDQEAAINSIDEYILQFSPEVQKILQSVRRTIKEAAPNATEKISWRMPTFVLSGNLVHFAAFKKHIGFYPGADGIEKFKNEFSNYKFSKGAVQFPIGEPIPYELITRIVKYRVEENLKAAGIIVE